MAKKAPSLVPVLAAVFVAVVLLSALGGLVAWAFSGTSKTPAPAPTSTGSSWLDWLLSGGTAGTSPADALESSLPTWDAWWPYTAAVAAGASGASTIKSGLTSAYDAVTGWFE